MLGEARSHTAGQVETDPQHAEGLGTCRTKCVLEECGSDQCPTSLIPEFLLQWRCRWIL